ncbi:MAG: hypothetical protein KDK91_25025, partial [Gammaproteobacteria bacterium]|nr:hypothetical protein [Gammaproteobacteria bacterium]
MTDRADRTPGDRTPVPADTRRGPVAAGDSARSPALLPGPGGSWNASELEGTLAQVLDSALRAPQRITAASGESLVMLNEADYMALLERLGWDIDMVDRFRASAIHGPSLRRPVTTTARVPPRLDR